MEERRSDNVILTNFLFLFVEMGEIPRNLFNLVLYLNREDYSLTIAFLQTCVYTKPNYIICVYSSGSNKMGLSKMGLFSKLKMKGNSKKNESSASKVQIQNTKSDKCDYMGLFKDYLLKTSSQTHIIDLNEKSILPPEMCDLSVEELVNLAFNLIQNDQLDAKLIGEVIII